MKQLVEDKIIFNPADKTLDFSMYPGFDITKLYAVINVTANAPIYVAGAPGLGVSNISGSIVTLNYNTASQNSADRLNVYYDTAPGYESNTPMENGGNLEKMALLLGYILAELKVLNMQIQALGAGPVGGATHPDIEDLRRSVTHTGDWEDLGGSS